MQKQIECNLFIINTSKNICAPTNYVTDFNLFGVVTKDKKGKEVWRKSEFNLFVINTIKILRVPTTPLLLIYLAL